MKLIAMPLKMFLDEIDAPTAIPGGGSAAAFGVAMGISLLGMVGKLTMTKKKFLQLDEKVKDDFYKQLSTLGALKQEALTLVESDAGSYQQIMEAYRLPKESDEHIAIRKQAIDQATIHATEVPLLTAKTAFTALEIALPLFPVIVKSTGSDFGIAVLMLEAGLVGAVFNVRTNMAGFMDAKIADTYLTKAKEYEEKGKAIAKQALFLVNELWK